MACPGQLANAAVQDAIGKVAEACRKHGKAFGMHGSDAMIERWIPVGFSLIMSSNDISMIATAMKGVTEKYGN